MDYSDSLLKHNSDNPIDPVFKRLRDAVLFWARAASSYHDYDEFRTNANACIQAIRSVTFILQKQKSRLTDFDTWYGQWQKKMGEDKILKQIVEARNIIEKEGDLEINSTINVQILASYTDSPFVEFRIPPLTDTAECFKIINNRDLPEHIRKNGIVRLERKWVTKSIGELEIIESLAHACNYLFDLVVDAYNYSGNSKTSNELKTNKKEFTLQCSDTYRTVILKISTGETYHMDERRIKKICREKVIERYGNFKSHSKPRNFRDEVNTILEWAMVIMQKDGYHIPTVLFILPKNSATIMALNFEDQAEKYMVSRRVADEVKSNGATAVITVLESWMRPLDTEKKSVFGAAHQTKTRKECLVVTGISQKGEEISLFTEIHREKANMKFSDIKEITGGTNWFLEPVKKVWRQEKISDQQLRIIKISKMLAPHINREWKLEHSTPCLCLSGIEYKSCCMGNLEIKLHDQATRLFEEKKYAEAETAHRTWLTQYIIWFNQQTVPTIKANPAGVDKIVVTDIEAISEIVEDIAICVLKQGKELTIDGFLEKAINLVGDSRYQFCATVLRSFYLSEIGEFEEAKKNLKSIDPDNVPALPQTERSRRMLRIYIDLMSPDLSTDVALKIIDDLLALLIRPLEKMDLLIKKSLTYYLALDSAPAEAVIDEALSFVSLLHPENMDERKIMLFTVGEATKLKGMYSRDKIFIKRALKYYEELLPLPGIEGDFKGEVHQKIAHIYDSLDDPNKALEHLKIANQSCDQSGIKLDLIQAYIRLKNDAQAIGIIKTINEAVLSDAYKIDFYEYKGTLAKKVSDDATLKEIIHKLEGLSFVSKFLEEKKQDLLGFLTNKLPAQ